MYEAIPASAPPPTPCIGRPPRYPFPTMTVGELFIIPAGTTRLDSMKLYVNNRSKALKKKFTVRQLINGDLEIYRRA